jgi:hypothetical protein
LGNLEYLAQSNNSANCVKKDSRFKFVDDLTALEKIDLLLVAMASHNTKHQVPNDIHMSNQIIPSKHLKSQIYLNQIQEWTIKQKMVLSEEKTKCMVFNFSKKRKFSTRLSLNNKNLETVKEVKLLGTIITDDLKWVNNTKFMVKRAYSRMELLRQMANFTKSTKDKIHIYKVYIRSVLEQSCVVWHHNISKVNEKELERVQKVAVKLITNKRNQSYNENLKELSLETLKERRQILCARFAYKCVKNPRTKEMFPHNKKDHIMKLRNNHKFKVPNVKTARRKNSAIPNMINHLNKKHNEKQELLKTLNTQ